MSDPAIRGLRHTRSELLKKTSLQPRFSRFKFLSQQFCVCASLALRVSSDAPYELADVNADSELYAAMRVQLKWDG